LLALLIPVRKEKYNTEDIEHTLTTISTGRSSSLATYRYETNVNVMEISTNAAITSQKITTI